MLIRVSRNFCNTTISSIFVCEGLRGGGVKRLLTIPPFDGFTPPEFWPKTLDVALKGEDRVWQCGYAQALGDLHRTLEAKRSTSIKK